MFELELENFMANNYEPSFTASREEVEKLVKYLQAYLEEKKIVS